MKTHIKINNKAACGQQPLKNKLKFVENRSSTTIQEIFTAFATISFEKPTCKRCVKVVAS